MAAWPVPTSHVGEESFRTVADASAGGKKGDNPAQKAAIISCPLFGTAGASSRLDIRARVLASLAERRERPENWRHLPLVTIVIAWSRRYRRRGRATATHSIVTIDSFK